MGLRCPRLQDHRHVTSNITIDPFLLVGARHATGTIFDSTIAQIRREALHDILYSPRWCMLRHGADKS